MLDVEFHIEDVSRCHTNDLDAEVENVFCDNG
jgi:hypothetical protein